jgi:SAM-dependent methyltransferase
MRPLHKHVYCSDLLAKHYITFKGRWLTEAWERGDICNDDYPIEECPFAPNYLDLVVLINVLDHVRDIILCLRQAIRITKPEGYLVVGQDLSNMEDALRTGDDIGHLIRIDHGTLDRELMLHFDPLLHKILGREEGRNPLAHYGTYIFIGRENHSCQPIMSRQR